MKIISVGVGGAFGAVARYLLNVSPLSSALEKFPLPTFFINVSGSFFIGFLLILLTDRIQTNDNLRMAIMVGFLGAYTTFSTFEAELWGLLKENQVTLALGYLVLSVVIGFLALIAGVRLAENL